MLRFVKHIIFFYAFIFCDNVYAQSVVIEGEVSFITSQNIYVRFISTDQIQIGDTLHLRKADILSPCLLVQKMSSSSCVCTKISDCQIEKGDKITYSKRDNKEAFIIEVDKDSIEDPVQEDVDRTIIDDPIPVPENEKKYQKIRARLSASSYSSFDPKYSDRHRMMWRFSLNAQRVNDSKFSVESYFNYRKNFEKSNTEGSTSNAYLRVYNLAVSYQVDSSMSISIGRKINRKMSSVGAIDGLQIEKNFKNIYTGLVIGFRPDIFEYDFNPKLLEYGFFIGSSLRSKKLNGHFTLGFLEQRNNAEIDRRYSYLQFSSMLSSKASVFASMEVDLYEKIAQVKSSTAKLTNLFLSLRYKFNRRISVSLSFDSRKRILYYETLRTEIERLLADDEARQGIRIRFNIRPLKNVYTGFSVSRRFQSDNQNRSDNANAFVSLSRVPGIKGRLNLNYNYNKSNYLESHIKAVRYSRMIVARKLDVDLYFRNVNYTYFNTESKFSQNYLGMGLSWHIVKNLSLNILVEQSGTSDNTKHRVNTKLIKRFR